MASLHAADPLRRARRSFGLLVLTAVVSTGSLSSALGARPSPLTGLRVLSSGVVLVVSLSLAARLLSGLERGRRRRRDRT